MRIAALVGRVMLAILITACCAPLDKLFPHDAGPPPPPVATTSGAVPAASAGCPGSYHLELGPAVSPTSPYLAEHLHEGEQMPTGYVAAELTRLDTEYFTPCRVRVALYQYRLGARAILLEDPRDLHDTETKFMKSWHIPADGDFEVAVTDDATSRVLVHQRFPVRRYPVATHAGGGCGGAYDAVIGPAVSPTSPYLSERLHPGEHLHGVPVYVALELRPHGVDHFPACRMRFGLYDYAEDGKRLVVESERDMLVTEGVFDKSWVVRQPGDFEIAVTDVGDDTRLATQRFTVE